MQLHEKKCVPCEGGTPSLSEEEARRLLNELGHGWQLDKVKIWKDYKFADFKQTMKFVNAIASIAEAEGHHPDIAISYNKIHIEIWTHALSGLSENDFILAAKIEKALT